MTLPPALRAWLPADPVQHLEEALTHSSYANERRRQIEDNQRLEFLGDAVLSLLVSEELMRRYPKAAEGELSQKRASIVRTEALAAFARTLGLGGALLLGKGATAANERDLDSVLCDALEAILGAVYLDLGLDEVRRMVAPVFERGLARPEADRDAKSELQERVQAIGVSSPTYRLVATSGPDHQRTFEVEVLVRGEVAARASGRSKKAAEQEAARVALAGLGEGNVAGSAAEEVEK